MLGLGGEYGKILWGRRRVCAYTVIDDMLISGVVVYIDRHAAEGRHFGGEFGETGVVLPGCEGQLMFGRYL